MSFQATRKCIYVLLVERALWHDIYTATMCHIQANKKNYNLNVKVIKAVILSIWDLPVGVGTVHMNICYDGFPAAIYNQPSIVKLE